MIKEFCKIVSFIIITCFLITSLFGFCVFASEDQYITEMEGSILEKAKYSLDIIEYSVADAVYENSDNIFMETQIEIGTEQFDITKDAEENSYGIISGKISLPDGEIAPSGGLSISISADAIDGILDYYTRVKIAENQNSVEYSLRVPKNEDGCSIRYYIDNRSVNYIQSGYYNENGTAPLQQDSSLVNVSNGDVDSIDIELIKGVRISGKISLSDSEIGPSGGLSISIFAEAIDGIYYDDLIVVIPSGQNYVRYSMLVLKNDEGYSIRYSIVSKDTEFAKWGYYSKNGTKVELGEDSIIDVTQGNVNDIDIELIKGVKISGEILLPDGEVSPKNDFSIIIYAGVYGGVNYDNLTVTIPLGKNSAEYSILVPNNEEEYIVSFHIVTKDSDYIRTGYYSNNGTKIEFDEASIINVSQGYVSGVDIELIKGVTIFGKISLPDGEVAPSRGFPIRIIADACDSIFYCSMIVIIPSGENYAEYSVPVLKNEEGYIVSFNIVTKDSEYIRKGYYSKDGTEVEFDEGSIIDVSQGNVNDIDIELIKGVIISGKILLPDGEVATSGGLSITIYADAIDGLYYHDDISIRIPSGENYAEYSVPVLKNEEGYIVSFNIVTKDSEYIRKGYYSKDGTEVEFDEGSIIDVSQGNVNDIDIELIKGVIISGKILLPDGEVATSGGLSITIYADAIDGLYYHDDISIRIPSGKNSVEYFIPVFKNKEGYSISYSITTKGAEYVRQGYYSKDGITNRSKATIIDVSNDVSNIDLVLLKGKQISGEIYLPSQVSAPVSVVISAILSDDTMEFSEKAIIEKGNNSARFSINVLPNDIDGGYYLMYRAHFNTEYLRTAFYSINGATNIDSASIIDVSKEDINDIIINMIHGYTISGKISMPEGKVAPTGGMRIRIMVDTENRPYLRELIVIPEGESAVDYKIAVPPNIADSGYLVGYSISKIFDDLEAAGYYNKNGTVKYKDLSDKILIKGSDISNIDLKIMNKTINVTGVTLNKKSAIIEVGQTIALSYTIAPSNATNQNIIWVSSNNNVATISSTGVVKGLNAGQTKITVTTIDGNKSDNCTIEVKPKSSTGGNTRGTSTSYAGGSGGGGSTKDTIEEKNPKITKGLIKFEKSNPTLNTKTRMATVQLDEKDFKLAETKDSTNNNGNNDITIEIEDVSDIKGYSLQVPISILNKKTTNRKIIIKTSFGKITLPNSVLDTDFAEGSEYIDIFITKQESNKIAKDIKKLIGNRDVFNLGFMINGVEKSWSNPNIPIKVSFKYEPTEEELKNTDNIVVYFIDESGKADVISNGKFDSMTNQIVFHTTHFSKYAIAYTETNYKDLEKTKWAEKEINAMSAKGVIRNDSIEKFEPQKSITRAEFIYGLIKAMGFTTKVENNFNDINIADYYYNEIAIAKKLGISNGVGNNDFHPLENITRQDMMTLITRALIIAGKIKDTSSIDLSKFKDSNLIASYAKESVCTMIDRGIIIGDGVHIKPLSNATRAETAAILYRIYSDI